MPIKATDQQGTPTGIAHVSTSKNLLNMQGDSNGEYFGTMSQGGYSVKNLYIGSPSFDGYGSLSSWEDGGTFNGMPVIKRAGSWTGAFKLVDVIAGKTYTFSTWIKSDQARPVAIYATGGSTGATATISPGSKPFISSTNWERVSFTFTCDTSGSVGLRVENRDSSETNYTYIAGYQLELGPDATSYERYIGDGVYSGKNLMIYPYAARAPFTNGITFTSNSDGTVVLNGQNDNNGNSAFFLYSSTPGTFTLPAGTYYFLRPSDTAVQFVAYDGTTYWNFNPGNDYSRTFNSSITFQDIYVQVPRGNTTVFNNLKIYPMLSTLPNQTQDDYEPYVGGIPSPSPDYPQEIVTGKLASKNLLDKNNPNLFSGYFDGDMPSPTIVSGVANRNRIIYIQCKPNTTYSMSLNLDDSSDIAQIQIGTTSVLPTDGVTVSSLGKFVGNKAENKTTPNDATYLLLRVQTISGVDIGDVLSTILAALQIEEGSVATSFEPYFTTIELAQKDSYQDKVYKSNSGWVLHKEMGKTDLATETWTKGGVGDGGAIYMVSSSISNIKYVPNNQTLGSGFAEKYIMRIGSRLSANSAINQMAIDVTRVGVNVGFTEVTPSGLFYYALNTPTDTAITDSATILWLNKYDTNALPHHKYVNTRRTTYVGASGLASAIDLYDGSYASTLPTYTTANDHHLTTANDGTYTVSLQNISAKIVSGTVTFSVFTNQRKIDFSWNGSATSTNVSVSLQEDEYIKSIYAYIPQDADAGITLSQQLESGSLTDFEPYYNIVKIYAGDDLVFEDTSLTD